VIPSPLQEHAKLVALDDAFQINFEKMVSAAIDSSKTNIPWRHRYGGHDYTHTRFHIPAEVAELEAANRTGISFTAWKQLAEGREKFLKSLIDGAMRGEDWTLCRDMLPGYDISESDVRDILERRGYNRPKSRRTRAVGCDDKSRS
jgi:hypothetical protein